MEGIPFAIFPALVLKLQHMPTCTELYIFGFWDVHYFILSPRNDAIVTITS